MSYGFHGILLGAAPTLVFRPVNSPSRDVFRLTLFLATPEKDDIIVLLSKINAIAGTEVHSELVKASA
jgi:hypothetical protein